MNRIEFAAAHPEVFLIDPGDPHAIARYLHDVGVLSSSNSRSVQVARAGDGNMNCTVRVIADGQPLIVKQGRPWVEKYDHIAAPWDRTLVEAAFYEAVTATIELAHRMPRLVYVDRVSRILVLEDEGALDATPLYAGAIIDPPTVDTLTDFLIQLHALDLDANGRVAFTNREMRALNHEHIFRFPLQPGNGLDLDRITPGLQDAARELRHDADFTTRVAALGDVYLADGPQLVHGDFFPGSWLRTPRGPVIIDPEFCFLGRGEFDFGVMIAHLILAHQPFAVVDRIRERLAASTYDSVLIWQFAGVEIMRRLIGVAQLSLQASLLQKRAWLAQARDSVLAS
ncbi:MAG TPA: phosphotransferase [Vicinamibacterales bacterium]|nr:phosphotransferase [Vicinamibacterales bacterium]